MRGEAVLRLLRRLAQPGSLVVLLEDLHWADPDSLATIEYLGDNVKITALSQQVDQASSSIPVACVGPRGPARGRRVGHRAVSFTHPGERNSRCITGIR